MSGYPRRKRRYAQGPLAPTQFIKHRRAAARALASIREPAETPQVIEDQENGQHQIQPATRVEDVVDLTCDASDTTVVDLTNNDSVLVVDEVSQDTRDSESFVVSSDDEEVSAAYNAFISSTQVPRSTPGLVSCPVCMDNYSEIVGSGRLIVSTKCGHVFCSQCLRDTLASSHNCPTCRKKLTNRQYHPLYI